MKYNWDWQMFINVILFAIIIAAFVLAILSFVRVQKVATAGPVVVNGNNTYIKNVSSAPNLVTFDLGITDKTYAPKSTDNGSTIILKSSAALVNANFDIGTTGVVNNKNQVVKGYYLNVVNGNTVGGASIELYSNLLGSMVLVYTLAPGKSAYYYQQVSDLNNTSMLSTGWNSDGTPAP